MHQNIQELSFQDQPIHIFEYDGKIAFIAQQIGDVLGVKDVARGVRDSKSLEKGVDFDVAPSNLLPETGSFTVSDVNRVTILYLSGFFLFVLRSNKDIAVPFTRWAIREAIPQAFQKRQLPELSENGLIKMFELENKGSMFANKLLTDMGYIPAVPKQEQLTIDGGQP